jgi:hypothetical protein
MLDVNKNLNKFMPLLLFMAAFALHITLSSLAEINIPDSSEFLSRIVYVPAMLIFDSPFDRFTAMLVTNGIFVSLIPAIAYKITVKIGVEKLWQRVLTALIAGLFPAIITETKQLGDNAFAFLFPMLIGLILMTACDYKKSAAKHLMSILLAFVATASVFTDSRMLVVCLALIITVVLKRKSVSVAAFLSSLIIFSGVVMYLTSHYGIEQSTIHLGDFNLRLILHHLYDFTVSTWGLGILGIVLFIQNLKNNTSLTVFSIFAVCSVVFGILTNLTAVTPLILISTVCCICIHNTDLQNILTAVITLCIIFILNFADHITISAVFCVMAMLIVIVCCAKKHRTAILSGALALIATGTCIYVCFVTLPHERDLTKQATAEIHEISDLIYNSADAPPVIVPETNIKFLQFLNQYADIRTEVGDLEYFFFITESLEIHAIGDKAIMYALSQE